MEITCYRDNEKSRESRELHADTYNLAITLLARSDSKHLFVPIRSMQYMAIVDADEFVFIDGERKCWIDIAWQNFQRKKRTSLVQPITYDAVYYREGLPKIMTRLQREFPLALRALIKKTPLKGSAHILRFPGSSD
ncbi:hypothetical protein SAMN05216302_101417 [Nitrosomonas aestuarii]|uniref:Uncharacterized protein n=1 Tax=Nitrosomonas aestuarii TaxID=52441 RepID=A0A1I4BZI8_9PROT|nr:hypothetical protein [Nitrosomonas aestuarii]SFK73933.1 hypothetical protein SAMN05216302_101417 [Nitrosomonas aestuarii]